MHVASSILSAERPGTSPSSCRGGASKFEARSSRPCSLMQTHHFWKCRKPAHKPAMAPTMGVLPPPGTPGSYCPAPAIHYHISYNCCPTKGGAYGTTASPPMSSTDPDSPMACGTHYDLIPVAQAAPVPALLPVPHRSLAEIQEEPEEGRFQSRLGRPCCQATLPLCIMPVSYTACGTHSDLVTHLALLALPYVRLIMNELKPKKKLIP